MTPKTEVFLSEGGARIYRIPLLLFPELWGYAHLVVADGLTALVDRTKLVLGGHERPFHDLSARIDGTRRLYEDRLAQVLELARTPMMATDAPASMMVTDAPASMTIAEFAQDLFGETAGYHRLLALEEAGAYIEYLSMRGYMSVENLESLERGDVTPIRYQSTYKGSFAFQRGQLTAVGEDKVGELDVRI